MERFNWQEDFTLENQLNTISRNRSALGDGRIRRCHGNRLAQWVPRFPDGHWIAYLSDESGRYEVYVQGFTPSPHAGESAGSGKWELHSNSRRDRIGSP